MKASLDTNALIHFYRAGLQNILFELFDEGVIIYEQIYYVELHNHGKDVFPQVEDDIKSEKIELYSDSTLREQCVYSIFHSYVNETKILYQPGDMGEVYAISLAKTLGAYSLVTDDTKQGGPYMSLLQFPDEDVMPFNFADILILRYLMKQADVSQIINEFNLINEKSDLHWSFKSRLNRFFDRFWKNQYRKADTDWIKQLEYKYGIDAFKMMRVLNREIKNCANIE